MVELRMDRRIKARVDASDVLQECYLDLAKKLPLYSARETGMSIFVWMRLVAGSRICVLNRYLRLNPTM